MITGSAVEDQILSANTLGLADADGLGTFAYQWQRNGVNIGGATNSTYTLGDADVGGATMTVVVSYTDGQGFAENSTSAATSAVQGANAAPTVTDVSATELTLSFIANDAESTTLNLTSRSPRFLAIPWLRLALLLN